jgi:putative hydrolase of the HAD superfamily
MDTANAWSAYQTPLGPDHSAHSVDEQSFLAVRAAVHARRLAAAGVEETIAIEIGRRIDALESDAARYRLFDDTVPALERLASTGVRALIVSNHIWRLPEVVSALGLDGLIACVVTSARAGYRKPHPAIFEAALAAAGTPAAESLMVGDSTRDDVDGALRAGMRAVLLDRERRHAGFARAPVIHSLLDVPVP